MHWSYSYSQISNIDFILLIDLLTVGMKRLHKDITTDLPSATISITHHINLNFEIGTSNLGVPDCKNDEDLSKQENDRVNRPRSEN